jgi:hypothetical protein
MRSNRTAVLDAIAVYPYDPRDDACRKSTEYGKPKSVIPVVTATVVKITY